MLPKDLAGLHRRLNAARKAIFYDGEDPDLGELDIAVVVSDLDAAVSVAEAEAT